MTNSDARPTKSIAHEPASLDDATLASLWNQAYPDDLALSARLMAWCREAAPGRSVTVRVYERAGAPAAFVVASTLSGQPTGWVDALAVPLPRAGRRVRLPLLAAAEAWLQAQGCTSIRLGGGPWSLLRGVPAPVRRQRLLLEAGYKSTLAGTLNDMAIELARYTPLAAAQDIAGVVQPAQPRDVENIVALLAQPDRLLAAADEDVPQADQLVHLRRLLESGRLGDLMLLWTAHGLQGIGQIIFPDSDVPVDRSFPWTLPRPWSALGPVLTHADAFVWGSAALVDGALRRLHNNGINSCVAPAITRTTTWQEYGFHDYRRWQPFIKSLR